jgi:hypothetical protein
MGFESARLFIDRAQAALPAFRLTPANSTAVQEICHRLDGIPLAIELAAVRVRVFGVEQIAARLGDRFRLLTAGPRTVMPRQQTLQATVDWSYALLSGSGPCCGAFRCCGGWTLRGRGDGDGRHSAVCRARPAAALVEKSLVLAEQHRGCDALPGCSRPSVGMPASDWKGRGGRGHARPPPDGHFLSLAEEAEPAARTEARSVMNRLEDELDNLRMASSRRCRATLGPRSDWAAHWAVRCARDHHSEGRRWLARSLAASCERTSARMKALHAAGWLAHHQRDLAEARAVLEEGLAIARVLSDRWTVAWALNCLGRVAYYEKDAATARSLGEHSLAVAHDGDAALIAWAHHLLGLAAFIGDDDATARVHFEQSLAIRRGLGFHEGIGILTILLGLVAVRQAKPAEARALFQ